MRYRRAILASLFATILLLLPSVTLGLTKGSTGPDSAGDGAASIGAGVVSSLSATMQQQAKARGYEPWSVCDPRQ